MATFVEKIVDHYHEAMEAGGILFCFLFYKIIFPLLLQLENHGVA
jgi:hypothetical protein